MSTICHFEFPANDPEKLAEFYGNLFPEWNIKNNPVSGVDYWVIDPPQGKVMGGIYKRSMPEQVPCNYVDIPSVDEYAKKAEELGATVIMPKHPVPGMGWFALCLDPEKNVFGLWETDKDAK